jgi:CheY-like chemotaxis protein
MAVVTVTDTGIGLAPDETERVFEMFMQVGPPLERAQGGLGIGLTLVRRIVEMHGGTVTARSEGPGRGSAFEVRLPAVAATPAARPAAPEVVAEMERPCRVLVVDDNVDAAATLGMLLQLRGCEVEVAHDGVDAVAKAEAGRPDVVLLDIGMPRMNGYDACRAIRRQPWGKGPVVVALTGWGQDDDRQRSHEAGFDAHLVKPVDLAAVLPLLDRACNGAAHQPDGDVPGRGRLDTHRSHA